MQGLFANRRTKHAAWFLITAMPLLLAAYMVFSITARHSNSEMNGPGWTS